ncbi:MAG TPA: isoprenylcysteine carboxylmethyltransferase family protein [Thermodesulfobacteriota bacterium]|nr:isoprenylcysteine carboxylmethyltransferase family protein [Thermodesulfobacteriota bacterium]
MNRYKKWSEREYSKAQRMMGVIFGGIVFWIIIPFFIVVGSAFVDPWLSLPGFYHRWINPIIALVLMVAGWLFANWTVKVQFSFGKGTPIPLMATQKLVVKRPYTYCRNPMTLGTTAFYIGIAIWVGSLSALGLSLIYPVVILIYIKLIEEKELEQRFGLEYLEYKRRTPFLIPHFLSLPLFP